MRRAVDDHLAQLIGSLGSHGAVALPGGVLNDDAVLAGVGGGKEGCLAKALGQLIGGQVIEGAAETSLPVSSAM